MVQKSLHMKLCELMRRGKMNEELIGIKECRDLRMYIHEFTKGCVLTKDEYRDIMIVLGRAAERLEKLGQVIMEN